MPQGFSSYSSALMLYCCSISGSMSHVPRMPSPGSTPLSPALLMVASSIREQLQTKGIIFHMDFNALTRLDICEKRQEAVCKATATALFKGVHNPWTNWNQMIHDFWESLEFRVSSLLSYLVVGDVVGPSGSGKSSQPNSKWFQNFGIGSQKCKYSHTHTTIPLSLNWVEHFTCGKQTQRAHIHYINGWLNSDLQHLPNMDPIQNHQNPRKCQSEGVQSCDSGERWAYSTEKKICMYSILISYVSL